MDEKPKNNGQFKMRMDGPADDNVIPTQVDDLRIEKLSTKVTIISIIIPVLIVVVLTIAYLDMKKRVLRTQDTGTSGVENLSKDVESRFSTLSIRQANLEELIKKMGADNNKAIARIQVKLKRLDDASKRLKKETVSMSLLESKTANLQKEIGNVAQAAETSSTQVAEMNQGVKEQMEQISTKATQNQARMAQIDEKLTGLDQTKIDKASLDLALKLEILKLKQTHKAQLDDIQERIRTLERRLATSPGKNVPPSKPSSSMPHTPSTSTQSGSGIVEQKIGN